MGNEAAKVIVPMAIQSLPVIIKAIRGDENSANRPRTAEDRRLLEIVESMQRNRNDLDRILENQQQLLEAYRLLGQRVNGGVGNLQIENGTGDQQGSGTSSRSQIRIVMDLPEGAEEREVALQRFWETLSVQADIFKNKNLSAQINGSKNGCAEEGRQAIAASAPPGDADDSSQEVSKLESLLYCEICTQRYNTTDCRPTILPQCGHTFCKKCLCKANRRNHQCPHCRQITNVNVDQHPTNYAVLDFLKESEEKSESIKKKMEEDLYKLDLSFDEQMEIARQESLELSQSQQISEEKRKKQEEDDRRLALQIQSEDVRLVAFRFHEDKSQKGRNMNDGNEYMNTFGDQERRLRGGGHYPVLPDESQIESHNGQRNANLFDEDDDTYDICHASLRTSRVGSGNTQCEMEKEDDSKESSDAGNNHYFGFSTINGHEDTHHSHTDVDGKNLSDSDEECLKHLKIQEDHDDTLYGDDESGESRPRDASISSSRSLYEDEKELMLRRAEETGKQNKELRKNKRRLREQEDIDTAIALSLSLCETEVVPSNN